MGKWSQTAWRIVGLAALLAGHPDGVLARQVSSLSASETALRREVLARFDVALRADGVALTGATPARRVEIDRGVVTSAGVVVSGAELRARLGADASVVLRLSYLDNATLQRMFTPARADGAGGALSPPAADAAVVGSAGTASPSPAVDSPAATPTRVYRRSTARLALGKSIVIGADEDVREAVFAVGGDVRIEGRVRHDVIAIGGDVELAPTAEVRGDITVIGGELTLAPGARHTGRLHQNVGRRFEGWTWPTIGWSRLDLGGATRWVSLAGTLTRVTLLAVAVAAVVLLAGSRVTRISAVAGHSPWRAAFVGLGTQVLFVPALVAVSVAMAVTIIGLPFVAIVVPLAVVSLGLAMLLGFSGIAHSLGRAVERRAGWTPGAFWMPIVGLALVVLPTVLSRVIGIAPDWARALPLALLAVGTAVEYVAWTIGLGAAVMTGLGQWSVVPPPLPSSPQTNAPTAA